MNSFLLATLSAIVLLTFSVAIAVIAKKFRFPYTVALVGAGIWIAFLSHIPFFSFIDNFSLTPEMLLYIFLPILLFEAAYNIEYREFFRNIRSISAFSVISLLISTLIIAFGLQILFGFFGIHIPFSITFLFGALISATDPVAVLALFKELWAPKRLTLIFEGESLFNDGTALALFLVALAIVIETSGGTELHLSIFLEFLRHAGISTYISGFISFSSMILWGILFGGLIGWIFSHLIWRLRNEEFLELALTLSLAHMTYIGAEMINHTLIPISGVIATTVAAMVLWNYGRYKISPNVEKTLGHYWEFFAFITNSLVFILVGVMVVQLNIQWGAMLLPIFLAVFVVMTARAISIYSVSGVLNIYSPEANIPRSWQHLLSWGSLRGALAIIMVLLIPGDLTLEWWNFPLPIRDFILALTVGCIVFTTFVKATTIFPIMKYFGLIDLSNNEEAESLKGELRMLLDVGTKLEAMKTAWRIPKEEMDILFETHMTEIATLEKRLATFLKKDTALREEIIRQTVTKHALWLERFWLKELFAHREIPESIFKHLLRKIENQSLRVSQGKEPIRSAGEKSEKIFVEYLSDWIGKIFPERLQEQHILEYLKIRARNIIAIRVLRDLKDLEKIDFLRKSDAFEKVQALYEQFDQQADMARRKLFDLHRADILPLDSRLAQKALSEVKFKVLSDLIDKGTLSQKVATRFREDIEKDLYASFL